MTAKKKCTDSNQISLNDKNQQVPIMGCALETKATIYDCHVIHRDYYSNAISQVTVKKHRRCYAMQRTRAASDFKARFKASTGSNLLILTYDLTSKWVQSCSTSRLFMTSH